VVARSVANSLPFLLDDAETGQLVAFARVITDKATFAYLADVFVVPEYRGHGLGKRLVEGILTDPDLQNLRRFLLFTLDAHGLYAQYGFVPVTYTDRVMERFNPNPYPSVGEDVV
jgi:N-acetylglutamate synthase-like GNAT family acetyltransferase